MHDHIKSYISAFKNFSSAEKELFIRDFCGLWAGFSGVTPEKRQIIKTIKSKNTARIQQRYWEMYLYHFLTAQNLDVRIEKDCLDFCVNNTIWIEATAPEQNDAHDDCASRLLSAIEAKQKQFLKHKDAGMIQESAPFIIALNGALLGNIDVNTIIPKALHLTDKHSDISGIIFSMINPFDQALHNTNPPMHFIHNPYAKNPIAPKTLRVEKEYCA